MKKPGAKVVGKEDSLPAGWEVEEFERRSGAKSGEMYKIWVDPAGNRYRSKKAAFSSK